MIFNKITVVFAVLLTNKQLEAQEAATTGADIVSINKPCRESSTEVVHYLGNVGSKQYFIANSGKLVSWSDAVNECTNIGMRPVRITSQTEMNFVTELVFTNKKGPFWFGARDLGSKNMYRWTDLTTPPVSSTAYSLGTFVKLSDTQNETLALQMNADISSDLFPAFSKSVTAKAFCQNYLNNL